jgi:hypothetical protein
MQIAPVLGDETTLKLICETLGLIDEYEDIKAQREAEAMTQLGLMQQAAQISGQAAAQDGSATAQV